QQATGAALAELTTADQARQVLREGANAILYFYCHAISKGINDVGGPDASALLFTGFQAVTLGDLRLTAPVKKPLSGAPLIFINACESAQLSPLFYDGFVPYFIARGARGVIGTECQIPAVFADEFGRRFFDRFLCGEPLGQSFLDLRREFLDRHNNPLGLLYALYSDGDTLVAPPLVLG
ncbi:MAG: CHAT domain-containing protein, partial [Rudaea sp.]